MKRYYEELILYGYECNNCNNYIKVNNVINFCPICGVGKGEHMDEGKFWYDGEWLYRIKE